MSIRITTIPEPGTTVIKIDGRLTCDDAEEALRILGAVAGLVALDLSDLQSIDRAFVDRLREMVAEGMQVRAASPYVELLLQKRNHTMRQTTLLVLLLWSLGVCEGHAQEPDSAPPHTASSAETQESSPDLDAIRAGSEAFVDAFRKQDAKAIAAMWTEDGEYVDESGRRFAGREAIEKAYAEFFADDPDAEMEITIDSLRLVGPSVALEEGRAVVEPAGEGAAGVSRYTAVHAKVDGQWLMASVRDRSIEVPAAVRSAADLDWLIGTWRAEEHGVQIESVSRWVADGRFIERRYTTTRPDGTETTGVQLIGWNPRGGHVQSWDFSPDGGHAIGVWTPTEGGWRARVQGVTGAGVATEAVNWLIRLDDNAYVWQSMRRYLGDIALPDTDEVVIKRQSTQ